MKELIFEIGCEDLPSRFVSDALAELSEEFEALAEEARLEYEALEVDGTPRRLTLLVSGLKSMQRDLEEERVGPPERAGYKDGEPTKAAIGFAKGLGLEVGDLYLVDQPKGRYVAAKVFEAGKPAEEVLPDLLTTLVSKLNFPKSMRWGSNRKSFARPIRWLLAYLNDSESADASKILPVVLEGFGEITASNKTHGHRFSPRGRDAQIEVTSIESYKKGLHDHDVVFARAERRQQIVDLVTKLAEDAGGEAIIEADLLDEVTDLVEKPHGVLLPFDAAYLELPDEVLITSMRTHQRYFPIREKSGNQLMAACVVIYNTPVKDPIVVRDGNHRVLRARLDDAKFFWRQDLSRSLADYLPRLENVTWINEIGSVLDRTKRISETAAAFAKKFGLSNQEIEDAKRAGLLSKADLVTSMVFEFTDLQGVMGAAYAEASGENREVVTAVYEQYLPKSVDDGVPTTRVSSIVALAEKFDALVGCFGVGLVPTSAADPYALRRAAIGLIKILQGDAIADAKIVPLRKLIRAAFESYLKQNIELKADYDEIEASLGSFITTRLAHQMAAEYTTDIVQAVLAVHPHDIRGARQRIAALETLYDEADFEPLAAGFKRVVNLLKRTDVHDDRLDPNLFELGAESALYAAVVERSKLIYDATAKGDYLTACRTLIELKQPIDDFFNDVMVMVEDKKLKRNRLALLTQIKILFFEVADLSCI